MTAASDFWDDAAKDPDVRFKYIADDWATTEEFIDIIESHNNKWGTVLEIGCGIGRLLEPLSDNHETCEFYGIDLSDEMIKLAPKKPNITYQRMPKQADLIYSMLVMQHIPHQEKIDYIKTVYKTLNKGGTFLFQFVVGEENSPYSYQTNYMEIFNALCEAGFSEDKITNFQAMHHQWLFVKAIK